MNAPPAGGYNEERPPRGCAEVWVYFGAKLIISWQQKWVKILGLIVAQNLHCRVSFFHFYFIIFTHYEKNEKSDRARPKKFSVMCKCGRKPQTLTRYRFIFDHNCLISHGVQYCCSQDQDFEGVRPSPRPRPDWILKWRRIFVHVYFAVHASGVFALVKLSCDINLTLDKWSGLVLVLLTNCLSCQSFGKKKKPRGHKANDWSNAAFRATLKHLFWLYFVNDHVKMIARSWHLVVMTFTDCLHIWPHAARCALG